MKPKLILQISVLLAAALSLALSITLYFAGNDESDKLNGIYVGVWVPSILALGPSFWPEGKVNDVRRNAFHIWFSHLFHRFWRRNIVRHGEPS